MTDFFTSSAGQSADVATLDDIALRHGGVLTSIGYGYACTGPAVTVHGWSIRWIDRRGMGNHGTAVLVPTNARTRAIWRDGQMCTFRRAGVPERYIERLVACRISRKHELLSTIAAVLRDPALIRAVCDFGNCGGGMGFGGERACWSRKWSPIVDDISLSEPRMISLADIVRNVAGESR